MKFIVSFLLCLFTCQLYAQELFTWTEPASNMPAKSIGIRATNLFKPTTSHCECGYGLLPEVMWGISKKFMIHAEGFLGTMHNQLTTKGAGMYLKYRFYSRDEVHNHFRMAAFTRYSTNNSVIHNTAINLEGDNSGYALGLIATKLIDKTAFAGSLSLVHATDNTRHHVLYFGAEYRNAVSYNLSLGTLVLPREYKNYNQTNMNLMLEFLGQTNWKDGKTYVDIAPAIQFILLSKMRFDLGYRFALLKDLERDASQELLIRLEYNIFNVYK